MSKNSILKSLLSNPIIQYLYKHIIYNRSLNYAEIKTLILILSGLTIIFLLFLAILCLFAINSIIQRTSWPISIKKSITTILFLFLNLFGLLITIILILFPSLLFSINKLSFPLCCTTTLLIAVPCFFLIELARKKLISSADLHNSYTRIPDPDDMPDKNKSQRKKTKVLSIFNALILLYSSFAFPLLLENICFASWTPYGFNLFGLIFSTKIFRELTLSPICPPGPPCHVYATLSGDASTSFFLNVHTNINTEKLQVFYDTLEYYNEYQGLRSSLESVHWSLDIEPTAERNVHAVHFQGLSQDTEYFLQVVYDGKVQYNSTYRTLPDSHSGNPSRNIVVVAGGDVGSTEPARKITEELEMINPDVIVVGGDGAYDNGMRSCYYSYDLFLGMFENLNQKLSRLVPMILGIGNHELGIHSMSEITVPVSDTEGPLYFLYFPQHLTENSEIPSPANRKTYFPQVIGNTLHLSLDSGYMTEFNGTQADWIKNVSNQYPALSKFAHYHVPTIPSCHLVEDNPDSQMNLAYNSWSLTFEDLSFEAAFEYHYHLFKKTFPVKNKTVDANGVLYLGEGKWGASGNRCLEILGAYNQSGLLEAAIDEYHVWVMNISQHAWEYYPINPDGKIFYEKSLKNFFIQN